MTRGQAFSTAISGPQEMACLRAPGDIGLQNSQQPFIERRLHQSSDILR